MIFGIKSILSLIIKIGHEKIIYLICVDRKKIYLLKKILKIVALLVYIKQIGINVLYISLGLKLTIHITYNLRLSWIMILMHYNFLLILLTLIILYRIINKNFYLNFLFILILLCLNFNYYQDITYITCDSLKNILNISKKINKISIWFFIELEFKFKI